MNWSSLTNNPYFLSKRVAEQAGYHFTVSSHFPGWELYNQHKEEIDFVVVNPLLVFGPTLVNKMNASQQMLMGLFTGKSQQLHPGAVGVCDVRDVSNAHVIALENPKAIGQR